MIEAANDLLGKYRRRPVGANGSAILKKGGSSSISCQPRPPPDYFTYNH
jgi:hypothetical protein